MESLIKDLIRELEKQKEGIIKKVSLDSGIGQKNLNMEFEDSLLALKGLSIQSKKLLKDKKVFVPDYKKRAIITKIPKGKVLLILPSTTPILSCILIPLCAAFSGNMVVAKPSSKSKSIALFLSNFYKTKKIKNIKFKIGSGKEFLYNILHDNYDFIFFMGSEENGMEIQTYCNKNKIEYSGEYGGNDWAIVFDGNLEEITDKIAKNVMFKEGKDCDSIKGVLVNNKFFNRFLITLKNKLRDIKINENPSHSDITKPGFCSSLWIKKFISEQDILNLYKKNNHGLSVAIFRKDTKKALKLARKINIARVIMNSDTLDIHPLIPWGGIKSTSYGGVEYWVTKFTNKKLIEFS